MENVINTNQEIQNMYNWFSKQFYSKKYEPFRNLILKFQDKQSLKHSIEKFIILYSFPVSKPKVIIIGNNPSWFHRNVDQAKINLNDVAERIPEVNSYLDHGHDFGNSIKYLFDRINAKEVLEKTVGLNRYWIQTGGSGLDDLLKFSKLNLLEKEFKDLINLCENGTRKIVEILNPKYVLLFGNHAQNTFSTKNLSKNLKEKDINYISLTHPSRGQINKTCLDLESWFDRNRNHYEDFLTI